MEDVRSLGSIASFGSVLREFLGIGSFRSFRSVASLDLQYVLDYYASVIIGSGSWDLSYLCDLPHELYGTYFLHANVRFATTRAMNTTAPPVVNQSTVATRVSTQHSSAAYPL